MFVCPYAARLPKCASNGRQQRDEPAINLRAFVSCRRRDDTVGRVTVIEFAGGVVVAVVLVMRVGRFVIVGGNGRRRLGSGDQLERCRFGGAAAGSGIGGSPWRRGRSMKKPRATRTKRAMAPALEATGEKCVDFRTSAFENVGRPEVERHGGKLKGQPDGNHQGSGHENELPIGETLPARATQVARGHGRDMRRTEGSGKAS